MPLVSGKELGDSSNLYWKLLPAAGATEGTVD